METKTNLEEEKLATSNQMDQDYWAEKGNREEVEQELRNDVLGTSQNLESAEYEMKGAAKGYAEALNQHIQAGERLAKFLDQNPSKVIAGIDFGDTIDSLDNLTTN